MAKELSIFVGESGDRIGKARYYLLTLIFHDQADSVAEAVTGYEAKLASARHLRTAGPAGLFYCCGEKSGRIARR